MTTQHEQQEQKENQEAVEAFFSIMLRSPEVREEVMCKALASKVKAQQEQALQSKLESLNQEKCDLDSKYGVMKNRKHISDAVGHLEHHIPETNYERDLVAGAVANLNRIRRNWPNNQ